MRPADSPTWRHIGVGDGKDARAPASRGQRDAGAIDPIRPGAVGQIGGLWRQDQLAERNKTGPADRSPAAVTHPVIARSVRRGGRLHSQRLRQVATAETQRAIGLAKVAGCPALVHREVRRGLGARAT
jgi:hypothetical protein